MPRRFRIPSYRLHRPSGQAVVTLKGKDVYLGDHGSDESKAEYERVIREWLARHTAPATISESDGLAVAEVALAYLTHADTYYRDPEGNPTGELTNVRHALRPVESLYATTVAKDFGPLALKAVREKMIADGLSRGVVNQRVSVVKRMFKWASADPLRPDRFRTLPDRVRDARRPGRPRDRPPPVAEARAGPGPACERDRHGAGPVAPAPRELPPGRGH